MPSDQPCLQVQATSKLQARSRPLGFKGFLVLLHGQHFNYLYFKVNLKSCWPRDGQKLGDPGLKDPYYCWPELVRKKTPLVEYDPSTRLFILLLYYIAEQASQHKFKNSSVEETNPL